MLKSFLNFVFYLNLVLCIILLCKILPNFTFMKKLFLLKDRYCGSFPQEQVFPKYGLHKLVFER